MVSHNYRHVAVATLLLLNCAALVNGYDLQTNCRLLNEEYLTCGTACHLTCENYENPPQVCTAQCVIGCFCKEGFVRNDDEQCVLPEDCSKTIPAICQKQNEEFTTCGTSCPKTCGDFWKVKACDLLCNTGCFCKTGFVRDDAKNCILPRDCPTSSRNAIACSKPNEKYIECGTACPDTCDNYQVKLRPCTFQCVEGCFCRKGFVRNSDGNCIYPEFCQSEGKSRCGFREVFKECGSVCADTCDNYMIQSRLCSRKCVQECFCLDGYVRNKQNKCIRPKFCPKNPSSRRQKVFGLRGKSNI